MARTHHWLLAAVLVGVAAVAALALTGERHWAWFAAGLLAAGPAGFLVARRRQRAFADDRERLARFARVVAADALASRFNHTLSSPLQAAMLLAEQGSRSDDPSTGRETLREDIGIIHDALGEAATLLRDLREPTRLSAAGTLRTAPEAEIRAAAERAVADGMPRRGLRLELDRPMPDLAVEPDTLGVILHGLFDEARRAVGKATPGRGRVTLRAGREASSAFTVGITAPWDEPPPAWVERADAGHQDPSAVAISRLLVERVGGRTGERRGGSGIELWLSLPTV